jgi:hypothetical protein
MVYNFLLSLDTSGNLNPLLTAGRELRRNRDGVRVIVDPAIRDEVDAADFEFVTWRRVPIGGAADPAKISRAQDWLRQTMFDPTGACAAHIHDKIRPPRRSAWPVDKLGAPGNPKTIEGKKSDF